MQNHSHVKRIFCFEHDSEQNKSWQVKAYSVAVSTKKYNPNAGLFKGTLAFSMRLCCIFTVLLYLPPCPQTGLYGSHQQTPLTFSFHSASQDHHQKVRIRVGEGAVIVIVQNTTEIAMWFLFLQLPLRHTGWLCPLI